MPVILGACLLKNAWAVGEGVRAIISFHEFGVLGTCERAGVCNSVCGNGGAERIYVNAFCAKYFCLIRAVLKVDARGEERASHLHSWGSLVAKQCFRV